MKTETGALQRGKWITWTSGWDSHHAWDDLPKLPGVYVFMDGSTPLYIGSTCNLRTRLKQHVSNGWHASLYSSGWFDHKQTYLHDFRLKVKISRRWGDWLMWEARLLKKVPTVHNKRRLA